MKRSIFTLLTVFLALLTSCQKENLTLESFEVSPATLSLEVGQEATLRISVKPVYSDMTVTWNSSDPSVVTVADGKVTALKAGSATITATNNIDKSKTGKCEITVEEKVVLNSLSISGPDNGVVYVGVDYALGVVIEPEIPDLTFVWSTDDSSVIDVNPETGVVKGIKEGSATITVTCTDFGMNASLKLTSETKVLGGGKGSAADPFKITCIDDYKKFLSFSNGTVPDELKKYAFETASYILANDIDFTEAKDTLLPLFASSAKPFKGSFDGNNKTIKGLAVRRDADTEDGATGMFGYLGQGATVKNLVLDNLWVKSCYLLCGGVAGQMNGATVDNVDITGGKVEDTANGSGEGSFIRSTASVTTGSTYESIYAKEDAVIGGIAGAMETSTIKNCSVAATVYSSLRCVGGIVGSMLGSGNLVSDCTIESNTLIHTSSTFAGGISSSIRSGSTINKCTVKGLVESSYSYSGGIVAEGEGGTITDCTLDGASVALLKDGCNYIGGVIGYGRNGEFTISGCKLKNSAVYTTGNYTGGICGKIDSKITISDCHILDNSQIKVGMYGAGGIAAQMSNGTIDGCSLENSTVQTFGFYSSKAQSQRAGGIAAYITGGVVVKNCLTSGSTVEALNFEGTANADGNEAGGIVGLVSNGKILNCKVLNSRIYTGGVKCGGVAAAADTDARIENCYVDEKTQLESVKDCNGGMIGWFQTKSAGKSIVISNCVAKCKQTSSGSVAAMIGYADAKATGSTVLVINCAAIGNEIIGTTTAKDNNCGGLIGLAGTTSSGDFIYLVNCASLPKSINAAKKTAGGIYGNTSFDNICLNVYTPADYNTLLINGNPTSLTSPIGAITGWSKNASDSVSFEYIYTLSDVKTLGGGTPSLTNCETLGKNNFTDGTLLAKLNANVARVNDLTVIKNAGYPAAEWVEGPDGYPLPSGLPTNE